MDDKSNSVNYLTEYFVEPTKNLYKGIISGSSGIDLNAITQYAAIFASVFILMLSIGIISSNAVILWVSFFQFIKIVKAGDAVRKLSGTIFSRKIAFTYNLLHVIFAFTILIELSHHIKSNHISFL